MTAAKDREVKKLKLREKKQRDALAATVQALKSIESQCAQSIKHYKEQGWKENRTVVDIRELAAGALKRVEKLKAEFLEESPEQPAARLVGLEWS
jgi:predicted RNase H-like nuclease (RuvC/YqgF family)